MWWSVPGEERMYQRTKETWLYHSQRRCNYYLDKAADTYPLDQALTISVCTVADNFKIEGPAI